MLLFDVERDAEGRAKVAVPSPQVPSPEQLFRRRCYYLGISDPAVVARLWADEKQRRAEKAKARR